MTIEEIREYKWFFLNLIWWQQEFSPSNNIAYNCNIFDDSHLKIMKLKEFTEDRLLMKIKLLLQNESIYCPYILTIW